MEFRICEGCHSAYGTGSRCPTCQGGLSLVDPVFFLGKTFGKYRLEEVLGAGGMGVVYRAVHTTLGRPVALKILVPQLHDEQFFKRFLREAQVLAQLRHPNIVEVFDFDRSEWGTPYYVMEYMKGQTLRALIARQGPSPDLAAYADLLPQIARGLSCAHRMGLVHRDLKPDNIYVTAFDGARAAKIIDFGIAKLLQSDQDTTNITTTGTVMGTLNYLAPEQLLQGEVGPATDQYALGLICAEMVTGKPARSGRTLGEICGAEIKRPVDLGAQDLPGVPARVAEAVVKATQPEPANRFPSVLALVSALGFDAGDSGFGQEFYEAQIPTMATPRSVIRSGMAVAAPPPGPEGSPPAPPSGAVPATPSGAGPPAPSSAASSSVPAATGPRLPRKLLQVAGAALAAALVVGGGLFALRHLKGQGKAGEGKGPGGNAAAALSDKPVRIPIPPDARLVLCQYEDQIVLGGKDCLYLLSETSPQSPVRIPLNGGQKLLGVSSSQEVFILEAGKISVQDFFKLREPRAELARYLPAADWFSVSPSGRYLAAISGVHLKAFELKGGGSTQLFAVALEQEATRVQIGEGRLVAWDGKTLSVYSVPDGKKLWSAPFEQGNVNCVGIEEDAGLLCMAGWFDRVFLFGLDSGEARGEIPVRGQVFQVDCIPDSPTLAVAGEEGLFLWRRDGGKVFAFKEGDRQIVSALFTGYHLVALDEQQHELLLFPYRSLALEGQAKVGDREVWALASDPKAGTLYAGGSDGVLRALDVGTGEVRSQTLHTQGITALALSGPDMASASDDKTIAVWQIPEMKVTWRSRAHNFLVNTLLLDAGNSSLWSTSSDGTVKRWSWPQLEERETLDVRKLLGEKVSLAALWVAPDGKRILVGTHDNSFVALERDSSGAWHAQAVPVQAQALYSCAEIPGAEAVLFAGQREFGAWLYDLRAGRLSRIRDLGLQAYWVTVEPAGKAAIVVGLAGILRYEIARDPAGRLTYGVSAKLNTDIGTAMATAWVRGGKSLALGNERGGVSFVAREALGGKPLVTEILE